MGTLKYGVPEGITTALSTELNSLANNGAAVAVSGVIDNSTGLYKFMDVEVYTSQSITAGDFHTLHLIQATDGTNYEDGVLSSAETLLPASQLIGSVRLKAGGFERHILRGITLPPTKFKITFLNFASSALAASGNTVKIIRYNEVNA
jgi:hypothetical protein